MRRWVPITALLLLGAACNEDATLPPSGPSPFSSTMPTPTGNAAALSCGDASRPPIAKRNFVPPSSRTGDVVSIPIVFGDGSHAIIDAPVQLGLHNMSARPDMSGGPQKEWVRPAISFGGTPTKVKGPVDCVGGPRGEDIPVWVGNWVGGRDRLMYLKFGDWYIQIREQKLDLGFWARHLMGETTNDGWLFLRGTGSLKMGPQRNGGDSQILFFDRDNILSVWVLECQMREEPEISMEHEAFARFCSGDGSAEIHVQGKPRFVRSVAGNLIVRDVEATYPLDRYAIVP